MSEELTYYDVLKISRYATDHEVELAFIELSEQLRSLQVNGNEAASAEAQQNLQLVHDAYETLQDLARRKRYDSQIDNSTAKSLNSVRRTDESLNHSSRSSIQDVSSVTDSHAYCGNCGASLSEQSMVCINCGSRMPQPSLFQIECPYCQSQTPIESTKCISCGGQVSRSCPHCGKFVTVNATICRHCGTNIQNYDRRRFGQAEIIKREIDKERAENTIRIESQRTIWASLEKQAREFWLVVLGLILLVIIIISMGNG